MNMLWAPVEESKRNTGMLLQDSQRALVPFVPRLDYKKSLTKDINHWYCTPTRPSSGVAWRRYLENAEIATLSVNSWSIYYD